MTSQCSTPLSVEVYADMLTVSIRRTKDGSFEAMDALGAAVRKQITVEDPAFLGFSMFTNEFGNGERWELSLKRMVARRVNFTVDVDVKLEDDAKMLKQLQDKGLAMDGKSCQVGLVVPMSKAEFGLYVLGLLRRLERKGLITADCIRQVLSKGAGTTAPPGSSEKEEDCLVVGYQGLFGAWLQSKMPQADKKDIVPLKLMLLSDD